MTFAQCPFELGRDGKAYNLIYTSVKQNYFSRDRDICPPKRQTSEIDFAQLVTVIFITEASLRRPTRRCAIDFRLGPATAPTRGVTASATRGPHVSCGKCEIPHIGADRRGVKLTPTWCGLSLGIAVDDHGRDCEMRCVSALPREERFAVAARLFAKSLDGVRYDVPTFVEHLLDKEAGGEARLFRSCLIFQPNFTSLQPHLDVRSARAQYLPCRPNVCLPWNYILRGPMRLISRWARRSRAARGFNLVIAEPMLDPNVDGAGKIWSHVSPVRGCWWGRDR